MMRARLFYFAVSALLSVWPVLLLSQTNSGDSSYESTRKYTSDVSNGDNGVSSYLSKFEIDPRKDEGIVDALAQGVQGQKTIDSLIGFLHEQYPSLFKFPSLVFHSRSLHSATAESPRAILMSENARTLVAFNGDLNQSGGSRLELIHFNPESNRYDFIEVREEGLKLRMETNPSSCFSCHTNRAPIWDGYNSWPRFLTPVAQEEMETDQKKMAKMWADFKGNAKTHPRYRYLDTSSIESRFEDFGLERTTMGIQFWNLKRLADQIRQKDPEGKYSALIHQAFELEYGDTTEMESLDLEAAAKSYPEILSPDEFIKGLAKTSGVDEATLKKQYKDIFGRIFESEKLRYNDQIALSKLLNGREESPSTDVVVLAHLQLVLQQLGIDLRNYGLGTRNQNYDFATPRHGIADISHWLSDVYQMKVSHGKAESALSATNASHLLFTQCASCHTDGQRGPRIAAFQNENELRLKLKSDSKFSGEILSRIKSLDVNERMPYGYPALQVDQVLAVEELLRKLESPNCSDIREKNK